jgi:hypothetical protein
VLCDQVLERLLDDSQFLSAFGLRSLSKEHEAHPYHHHWEGNTFTVKYDPAESTSSMFGGRQPHLHLICIFTTTLASLTHTDMFTLTAGNSNWRGPIWFPVNVLMIEALQVRD